MQKNLRFLAGAAAGLVAAITFSSCSYDPYYSSVGGTYSSGYGTGGSAVSTSVFIGTGNPRWGYDPGCYSYYDYSSRRYYDPYLNGYYPVGYRPPVVYGVSHPYGWRPGSGYCRPPGRVTNVTISNYRNRESAYRRYGYSQGGYARQGPSNQGRYYGQSQGQNVYGGDRYQGRSGSGYQQSGSQYSRQIQGNNPYAQSGRQGTRSRGYDGNGAPQGSRYPSRYNSPVAAGQQNYSRGRQGNQGQIRSIAPPDVSRGNRQPAAQQKKPDVRSRGQGGGRYGEPTEAQTYPRGRN